MKISIGAFNADTNEVPVTLTIDGAKYQRNVRAVLKDDGSYDRAATKNRVEEVARGYPAKIAAGVVSPT
ncbi:hypothetical protein M2336_001895 [Sphingobium sp. B1D7B]|uniref:hypothetical protein n=1 Tax=Sphingobium sp. B1D7B TaxID=2940578 RepID=UPI0022254AD8|nr:hypothetical protein [Sphingobium sp. B1D7B]MCW2405266.1 hypothetical protein [Sphingobium sp. B1D7B]